MQLAMLHKTVCREEEKTLVCTIMIMAQVPTLSVNWTFIEGTMYDAKVYTRLSCCTQWWWCRFQDQSKKWDEAYTGTLMISELHTATYYKCVCMMADG